MQCLCETIMMVDLVQLNGAQSEFDAATAQPSHFNEKTAQLLTSEPAKCLLSRECAI